MKKQKQHYFSLTTMVQGTRAHESNVGQRISNFRDESPELIQVTLGFTVQAKFTNTLIHQHCSGKQVLEKV